MERDFVLTEPNKTAVFGDRMGFPEIPLVGSAEYKHSETGLPPHIHQGCLELVCLHKGRQIYYMEGIEYSLTSGMVFAAPPGRCHSTGEYPEDKAAFQWVQIDLSHPGSFLGLPPEESDILRKGLQALPTVFNGCTSLKRHLDSFLNAAFSSNELRMTRMRTELLAFLLDILSCAQAIGSHKEVTDDIRKCAEQINNHFCESVNWEDMARSVNLSDSRFRQKFREQLGLPPQEFLWRKRIDAAKEMILESSITFSCLSEELGFESPSYFTRVFRRYTGLTPTQYRKSRGVYE